ncbi:hypothetical protein M758_1G047700 [Ceratodon purpureus]|nr:hypothetical protein M758_1G047700 [Ceratodon purpureus]
MTEAPRLHLHLSTQSTTLQRPTESDDNRTSNHHAPQTTAHVTTTNADSIPGHDQPCIREHEVNCKWHGKNRECRRHRCSSCTKETTASPHPAPTAAHRS